MSESEYRFVNVESFDDGTIVRLMLNRPETRNAQHRSMLVELNEAFLAAEADDNVRVVILGGDGPDVLVGSRHRHQGDVRGDSAAPTSTRPPRSTAARARVPRA